MKTRHIFKPQSYTFLQAKTLPALAAVLLSAALLAAPGCRKTELRYDLEKPGTLADIDGSEISADVFAKLWQVIKSNNLQQQFGHNPQDALFAVMENMMLARKYKDEHGAGEGADLQVEKVYLQTVSFFIWDEKLEKEFNSVYNYITMPEKKTIRSAFTQPEDGQSGPARLDKAKAVKVKVIGEKGLPGGRSLADFYTSLSPNEQGSLHGGGNDEYTGRLLKRFASEELIKLRIAADKERKAEFAQIKQIVTAGIYANRLKNETGLQKKHVHAEDSDHLKEKMDDISMSRVEDYYQQNIEQFKEVKSAECRHITLDNEKAAASVLAQAVNSDDTAFTALVKAHSIHPDAKSDQPGLVSGVVNDPDLHKQPRLHTLCLMAREGRVEMFPDEDGRFVIIRSLKRKGGYRPLDETSTIITEIRRVLAMQDIKNEFTDMRKDAFKGVTIRINKTELARIGRAG